MRHRRRGHGTPARSYPFNFLFKFSNRYTHSKQAISRSVIHLSKAIHSYSAELGLDSLDQLERRLSRSTN